MKTTEVTAKVNLRNFSKRLAKRRRRAVAAELTIKRSKKRQFTVALHGPSTVLGRDNNCDIVVTDDMASRRHASINKTEAGHFEIEDLNSRNGTLVEGVPVDRMQLLDGDSFAIGTTRFTIHISDVADEEREAPLVKKKPRKKASAQAEGEGEGDAPGASAGTEPPQEG
jgi:pSer/pThr/pTyr-binding forkhead associated (FHA) protein